MADGVRKDEEFSGTRPVEERHRFDEMRLDGWMREHVEGYAGPLTVLQFKGGQSNPTYRLDTPGRSYVMRRKPFGKLLPSAHAVDREFKVIAALGKQGFPVAKAYALCTDDGVIGAASTSCRWKRAGCSGTRRCPARRPTRGARSSPARSRRWPNCINYDPETIGLGDFGKPGNYFARQVDRWTKQYRASETQHIPEVEQLIEWLPRTVPEQKRVSIVHGDYRLDNMIFHADRAAGAGGAGLGAVDARRSDGGLHLSADAVDHAGPRQRRPRGAQHPDAWTRPRRSIATSPARPCRT